MRALLRSLAADGRTVLVSSHLMDEMERTADHLVVIARGRLVADAPIAELVPRRESLEDVYTHTVTDLVDHRGNPPRSEFTTED
ncbi:hypothetical protein BH23ACT10_BH23ACT10_39940 [soil metagenome]